MEKAIQYFKDHQDDIQEILTLKSGSMAVKANLEFGLTTVIMEEALTMVDQVGKFEEKTSMIPDKLNEFYRLPKGVISSIAPFNFPLYLSMRTIAPAMCCSIIKRPTLSSLPAPLLLDAASAKWQVKS